MMLCMMLFTLFTLVWPTGSWHVQVKDTKNFDSIWERKIKYSRAHSLTSVLLWKSNPHPWPGASDE